MKRLITITLTAALLSGCISFPANEQALMADPDVQKATVYANMPYEHSKESMETWIARCFPNGRSKYTVPVLLDGGWSWIIEDREGSLHLSYMFVGTTTGINAVEKGSLIGVLDLLPEGNGTRINSFATSTHAANSWAKLGMRTVSEGGLNSCWW